MLSAVNGGSMTIIVGIIVVQIVSWIVAVFGMKFFHHYERRVLPCFLGPTCLQIAHTSH